ncbi:hypothetical protein [Candidatus Leptofilum sp.]|uniref:hypothetical protein n=1 Tax=Candidatus Leptofilum sp. TaxID=3241576 RepID=UPI003B5C0C8F
MYFGKNQNQSSRKGVIVFSFMLAVLVIFSAVGFMSADAERTAVSAISASQQNTLSSDAITATDAISATGVISSNITYLPIVFTTFKIEVSLPNSSNQWTVSWDKVSGATGYIIQESQDPNFVMIADEITVGDVDSYQFDTPLSFNNVYYYRVRPVYPDYNGPWSDSVMVIGGYRDDFNNDTSGWVPTRRMTYLEETVVRYGSGSEAGNLIIIVADRWDWLIGSPLKPAPEPPYAIEFRARVHDASNLVSGGAVFGGDWNGDACPEIGNVYQTDNCFNHFYNFNFIFYGPLKLLHEQVNSLVWCPTCGGSPIKRIGPTVDVDPILSNGPSLEWHTYRIEVRNSGVQFYLDGALKWTFSDTTYINEPYFGVFASTDEYKPSIWFYDYYQVTRLD